MMSRTVRVMRFVMMVLKIQAAKDKSNLLTRQS